MPSVTIFIRKEIYEVLRAEQNKTGKGPSKIIFEALEARYAAQGVPAKREALRPRIRE